MDHMPQRLTKFVERCHILDPLPYKFPHFGHTDSYIEEKSPERVVFIMEIYVALHCEDYMVFGYMMVVTITYKHKCIGYYKVTYLIII